MSYKDACKVSTFPTEVSRLTDAMALAELESSLAWLASAVMR